jgi:hypothetical protein
VVIAVAMLIFFRPRLVSTANLQEFEPVTQRKAPPSKAKVRGKH